MSLLIVIGFILLGLVVVFSLCVMAARRETTLDDPETTFQPDITEATRRKLWESIHNKENL